MDVIPLISDSMAWTPALNIIEPRLPRADRILPGSDLKNDSTESIMDSAPLRICFQ